MKKNLQILIVLALVFIGLSANAQIIPNSGFENWTTVGNYDSLNNWGSTNQACSGPFYSCTKSTDHYPNSIGSYSVRLENDTALLLNYCGLGTAGIASQTYGPGFPITGHPTSLTGWYKFIPLNGDTMTILSKLYYAGVNVSQAQLVSTVAAPNWTSFNIPFTSYTTADSGNIYLAAYLVSSYPHGNSVLYVDNLNFDVLLTGILTIDMVNKISVYPNPITTTLNIHQSNSQLSILNSQLFITDILGNEVYTQAINSNDNSISISNLSNGVYFYQITNDKETLQGKFIVQK